MSGARNTGLDVVRASAIALVLASHGAQHFLSRDFASRHYPPIWAVGVLGVELFFVLSGLLIGGLLLDLVDRGISASAIGQFLVRRWMRTLPLYYLTLILLLVFPGLDAGETIAASHWSYLWLGQNLLTPMPADNWFGPSWSLVIEEWSYIALPLLTWILAPRIRGSVFMSAIILCAIGMSARWGAWHHAADWDQTVRKFVPLRADAIAYGVILAWLLRRCKFDALIRLCWIAPPLLAYAAYLLCRTGLDDFAARVLLLPVIAVGFASLMPMMMVWTVPKPVAAIAGFVARISYGLYLVHWLFLNTIDWIPAPLRFAAFILFSGVVATALSYAIEQPFMRLRPRAHGESHWVPAFAGTPLFLFRRPREGRGPV